MMQCRYMNGVLFCNKRYMYGVSFLSLVHGIEKSIRFGAQG